MRIVVLGGNGFIGSHVVDLLVEKQHDVVVYDRKADPFRRPHPEVTYVLGEFSEKLRLIETVQGADCVIHLISSTVPSTSNIDPISDVRDNLVRSIELLQIMRASNVRKMIFLSSGGAIYGDHSTLPVHESMPLRPISSYGVVKAAIEMYIHSESMLHGLEYVVLRASNPYGPRQGHIGVQGLIGTFLWSVAKGDALKVWGDGSVSRDYIHVHDLARACVAAVSSHASGVYNAGSGESKTVNNIIDIIRCVTGKKPSIVWLPQREFDVPKISLDCSAAEKNLNWKVAIPLLDGISETWEWVLRETSRGSNT